METITNEITALLNQRIGLNKDSVGPNLVDSALRTRMAALRIERLEDYRRRLEASPDEVQELIESVIVPETWFFRQAEVFEAMVHFVLTEWLPKHSAGTLRILSVPCSTGEEPYSIVMALAEAGFSLERLQVDAMDISARALEHARTGIYRPYSFRNKDKRFQDRYFTHVRAGYRLKEALRAPVTFFQGNALELGSFGHAGQYDIIFCRNMLIYLDRQAQERVIANLMYCLQPDGQLFSSPAEYSLYRDSDFQSLGLPAASNFQKAEAAAKAGTARAASGQHDFVPYTARVARLKTVVKAPPHRVPLPKPVAVPVPVPVPVALPAPATRPAIPPSLLEQAGQMADAGRLDEAAAACERQLAETGESAPAIYLLGLIKDTLGDLEGAERLYRKALYLNPNHVEALMHLASLRAIANDDAQALRLRARGRRAQEHTQ